MTARLTLGTVTVAVAAIVLPAQASGNLTLSPGHTAVVRGHLQGVSPNGPIYNPTLSQVCLGASCDATIIKLAVPKGKRSTLTVTVGSGITSTGFTIRVLDAAGKSVGGNTSGGIALATTPGQGERAVIKALAAGTYTVRLPVDAGDADFPETLELGRAH